MMYNKFCFQLHHDGWSNPPRGTLSSGQVT